MPRGYHHLTYEQRCQIYALKQRGDSLSQIAGLLNVDKATVSRELHRNSGAKGYRYKQANTRAEERRARASNRSHKMHKAVIAEIEEKLHLQWSPEQISGWFAHHKPTCKVSHETIYKHVWADKRRGGNLFKQLRHHGKKYNKRSSGKAGRGCIPNRVGIEHRPPVVNDKCRVGDWELDLVIGRQGQSAIVTMVDRASKLTKLAKVPSKHAEIVEQAMVTKLEDVKDTVLTLTADNGKEFANHQHISQILEASFFFATPYHSWERGLNEHTNGLIRQYFPKGQSLDEVTQNDLDRVENLLNKRPRKVLQYSTPIEVFNQLRMTTHTVALQS
ncbi:MAG: IS30 family transposase [Candidatus Saccharimonadales bacterium]